MTSADLKARLSSKMHLVVFAAIMAMALIGIAVAYAVPMLDPSALKFGPKSAPYSITGLSGKSVYDQEGCVYCHTMQVRAVSNDVGLGEVTTADRAVRDAPSEFAMARIGPDLACVGSRLSIPKIRKHLRSPRSEVAASNMPSYGSLSDQELSDLAAYLGHLTCAGVKGGTG
ncbi:MAG: cbb3-type cytochrome c oxidase subunit II [Actinobacteria bacterium]|nr:cbb3-type cytochrome c oxidase subunit II [Actinomycetota bacterium]